MRRKQELTHELLMAVLDYEPETGLFAWKLPLPRRSVGGIIKGYPDGDGYLRVKVFGNTCLLHRLAWLHMMGEWPRGLVDHKDGVVTNNRWDNLREATHQQNSANRRTFPANKSGFKGVFLDRVGNWRAQIANGGKSRDLGCFPTPQAANDAYNAEAERVYGPFARRA